MWKSLRHPNMLPLLGVMMSGDRFSIVSEWMPNGDINQFVKTRVDVNRYELVSYSSNRGLEFSLIIE